VRTIVSLHKSVAPENRKNKDDIKCTSLPFYSACTISMDLSLPEPEFVNFQ
jgi:hypothetical protein